MLHAVANTPVAGVRAHNGVEIAPCAVPVVFKPIEQVMVGNRERKRRSAKAEQQYKRQQKAKDAGFLFCHGFSFSIWMICWEKQSPDKRVSRMPGRVRLGFVFGTNAPVRRLQTGR